WKWRAPQHGAPAAAIDVRDGERGLDANVLGGTDPVQELERRAIAAEEDVLPVVDEFARFAIRESRRAAAELRTRVEDEDATSRLRQRCAGTQAGDPAANDDHRIVDHSPTAV